MRDDSIATCILVVVTGSIVLIVTGLVKIGIYLTNPASQPPQLTEHVSTGTGPEATGDVIVDVIYSDGTDADNVAQVTSWLTHYSEYKLEAYTPLVTTGGDVHQYPRTFLIVGRK
jgi:hypothetical protein